MSHYPTKKGDHLNSHPKKPPSTGKCCKSPGTEDTDLASRGMLDECALLWQELQARWLGKLGAVTLSDCKGPPFAGLLTRYTLQPFEACCFSTEMKENHHSQGHVQVYNVRIPGLFLEVRHLETS